MSFDEQKTAQLASYFLNKRGGSMSYMKLIKLLYLADRESLSVRSAAITGDTYFSMKNGPVLSNVLNLINDDPEPETLSFWGSIISGPNSSREVSLVASAQSDLLSVTEIEIADRVFEKFGKMNRWEIRDYTHTLPEWHRIDGGRVRIKNSDILNALGKAEPVSKDDEEESRSINWVHRLIGA